MEEGDEIISRNFSTMQLRRTFLICQPRKRKFTYSEHKVVGAKIFLASSVELQNTFVSIIRKLLGMFRQVFGHLLAITSSSLIQSLPFSCL